MDMGVIVYLSARESGKQIATQTDEVWEELGRKSKNPAQNGAQRTLKIKQRQTRNWTRQLI